MLATAALDWGFEAVRLVLILSLPALAAALAAGIVTGLLQSLTQVHDPSIAAIPKWAAVVLVLALTLPWITSQLVEFTQRMIVRSSF